MKKNTTESFASKAKKIIARFKRADFDPLEKKELDAALQKLSEEQEQYKMANKIGEYSDEAMAQKAMQQQQMMAQQSQGQVPQGSPLGYPQGQQMQPDSQVGQMVGQGDQIPQFDGISGTSFMDMNDAYMSQAGKGAYSNPNYNQVDGQLIQPNTVVLNASAPTGAAGAKYIQNQNTAGNYIAGTNVYNNTYSKAPQQVVGQDQQIGQTQSILPSVIVGGIGMIGNGLLAAGVKDNQFNQSKVKLNYENNKI